MNGEKDCKWSRNIGFTRQHQVQDSRLEPVVPQDLQELELGRGVRYRVHPKTKN